MKKYLVIFILLFLFMFGICRDSSASGVELIDQVFVNQLLRTAHARLAIKSSMGSAAFGSLLQKFVADRILILSADLATDWSLGLGKIPDQIRLDPKQFEWPFPDDLKIGADPLLGPEFSNALDNAWSGGNAREETELLLREIVYEGFKSDGPIQASINLLAVLNLMTSIYDRSIQAYLLMDPTGGYSPHLTFIRFLNEMQRLIREYQIDEEVVPPFTGTASSGTGRYIPEVERMGFLMDQLPESDLESIDPITTISKQFEDPEELKRESRMVVGTIGLMLTLGERFPENDVLQAYAKRISFYVKRLFDTLELIVISLSEHPKWIGSSFGISGEIRHLLEIFDLISDDEVRVYGNDPDAFITHLKLLHTNSLALRKDRGTGDDYFRDF